MVSPEMSVPSSARSRRIAVHGTHARLANADVEIVNLSRTGVLVKAPHPLRAGTDWPLTLDVMSDTPFEVTARVVRCRPGSDPQDTTIGPPHHDLALAFVTKSSEADAALYAVCGSQLEVPRWRHFRPLRSLSIARRCPRCRTTHVLKERPRRYYCAVCNTRFTGLKVGPIRFAF